MASFIIATSGPPTTNDEVDKAIKIALNGKAIGLDHVTTEILKILGEIGITALTKLLLHL